MSTVSDEIKDFFVNTDVTKFAVAAVFGQTFYPIVLSLVNEIILPMFSVFIYKVDGKFLHFSFRGVTIEYGNFLSNLVIFILSMLVLFFLFIKPFKTLVEKSDEEKK